MLSLYPAVRLGARQQFIASQTISITKWYLLTLTWGFKKCSKRARDVNYDPVLVTMKQNKPEPVAASHDLPMNILASLGRRKNLRVDFSF